MGPLEGKLINDVREKLRENWLLKNPYSKRSYNIAVWGIGNLGRKAAVKLSKIDAEIYPRIENIYLVSSDQRKFDWLSNKIQVINTERITEVKQVTTRNIEDYISEEKGSIDEHINNFDICFITGDANKKRSFDRWKTTLGNIDMIKGIASSFKKEFTGSVVIVSNLIDPLAYVFAQYSEINPRQIIGMNYLDTMRLKSLIKKKIYEQYKYKISPDIKEITTNAYAIGHHQNPWPCLDNVMVNRLIPLSEIFSKEDMRGTVDEFLKYVTEYITKPYKESKTYQKYSEEVKLERDKEITEEETIEAIKRTAIAIMNQGEGIDITASTFYPINDNEGIYIGLPVDFERQYFKIREGFLEGLSDRDREELEVRVMEIIKEPHVERDTGNMTIVGNLLYLKQQNLIKDEPVKIPKELPNLEEIAKKEQELIFGAGGYSNKVYVWDRHSEVDKTIDVKIGGKEKFASCVKLFNYEDKAYIAIGTSSGILIKGVSNPDFRKELLITNPDGEIGHFRSIEVIDDFIIGSNYHLISKQHTGFGLFKADLEHVVSSRKPKLSLNDVEKFNEVTGQLAKTIFKGDEIIVFPSGKNLLQYNPKQGMISGLYNNKEFITALSKDGLIVGDGKGYITLLNNKFEEMDKVHAKLLNAAITAIEHVKKDGDHVLFGDKRGYFNHYNIVNNKLEKLFSNYMGLKDPLARDTRSKDIYPVTDIKYVNLKGTDWIFVACEKDIISFKLKDLLSEDKERFSRRLRNYGDSPRRVFSVDVYRGGAIGY